MDAGPKSAPISRCNSDFSMSTFPSLEKLPSASSDLSYRPSSRSTRASTSTQSRDDKSANLAKSLLSRSSRLLHKRKSSNRVRTLGWLDDEEDPNSKDVQELSNRRRSRHNRAESEGFGRCKALPLRVCTLMAYRILIETLNL